ncbi:MAG TPA: M48 family metalloprotease [Vicinamibacterales bacterium]|nr:M48 family metalloprotease [Vicinamibacterales bacterium]
MSEAQEIQVGRELDAEIQREMGVYEDAALQRYVQNIGLRLARVSERPDLPWQFLVVDVPAVNAFALPGGFIYLTRGILPFLDNEAQLAGVLGHEIGHVTARHSARQYTRATTTGLGLTLLGILVPEARPFQGVAETLASVLFLKYGREDELEADRFGVQYAARCGWDPSGVAGMLNTLARLDEATGTRKGVPNWLSTHPAPADRVEEIQAGIRQASATMTGTPVVDRATYLTRIDGLIFGDSPREGIVRGRRFLHPVLRMGVDFPETWEIQNTRTQVTARAPGRDHYMLLQLVENRQASLEQTARSTMANAGFQLLSGAPTTINGLDAYVGTYQGSLQGLGRAGMRAAHIAHLRLVYLLAGIAPASEYQGVLPQFERAIGSFRGLSESEAAQIRPNRVDIHVVRAGDTWEAIARRTGGVIAPATLAIMNGGEPADPPRAGDRIKVVVEG